MPTLDPPRRAASAYPPRLSGSNMQKAAQIAALVVGIFFLHNILFHDYRMDEIHHLTAMGKSAEEIKVFVPETHLERQQTAKQTNADLEELKVDVALLKQEIAYLKTRMEKQDEQEIKGHHGGRTEAGGQGGGESFDKMRSQEESEDEPVSKL